MSGHTQDDRKWMRRCFDLARNGIGAVSPNPPVGAVLIHQGRMISEGYHQFFGGAHAEVNVFSNLLQHEKPIPKDATLYVSLEPCCIYSKTPPCTDLILQEGIQDVRISILDPNPEISGRSVELMRSKGIKVTTGILEEEGKNLIRAFQTNILQQRPHIILKWAQSRHGFMGKKEERVLISHPYTSTWTHSLRTSVDAIMVGAQTVMTDNPLLTTRFAAGKSPHRIIYDPRNRLDNSYNVFAEDGCHVFYFSMNKNPAISNTHVREHILDETDHAVQILKIVFKENIGIVLVEGGKYLLDLFIQENLWDEAWVINSQHPLTEGVRAPVIRGKLIKKLEFATDMITGIANSGEMQK